MGDEDCHDEIGQQCSTEDLEDEGDAGEGPEGEQHGDEATCNKRPDPGRAGMEELHTGADGHQVGRNVEGIDILPVVGANVYDIVRHDVLVITKAGIDGLKERLA